MENISDNKIETPIPANTPSPSPSGPGSSSNSSSSGNSIVFTSPFEDTSGLDVFAQIAASAHPLPVEPVLRRSSIAATTSIVQQSQSQLAQSIYQNQQALRMQSQQQQAQRKRDSIDSTVNRTDPRIVEEEFDNDIDFDDDIDSDSDSDHCSHYQKQNIGSNSSNLISTPIQEETESDLMMDVDQGINFQKRRSPSLSSKSYDHSHIFARRLSAPDTNINNNLNLIETGGYSTRRVIHNICERKRRENIRDGFSQLQNRLPSHLANNPKLSKMETLVGAKNLINEIRSRISNLSAEVSVLSQISEQMEKNKKKEVS